MPRALFHDFIQDLRISARSLSRAPVLALTIIVTVGLGIGATVAIFTAVSAAILQPLPYAEPENLVRLYTDTPPFKFRFSAVDYLALTEQQTRFTKHATYTDRSVSFSDGNSAEVLPTRVVSWEFFSLLGIQPTIGRVFEREDGEPGAPRVAIASHGFWQRRLGSNRGVIGTTVRLDGTDYALVGVLPPARGPLDRGFDLFLIQQFAPPNRKGPFLYSVVARLPSGIDRRLAAEELRAINRRLFPLWKSSYQDEKSTWSMEDLKTNLVGDAAARAWLSLAAVALIWLIACVNASSLLIARVTGRRQELAVRAALGASRGRVLRYLLAESVWLAGGAVALGTGLAWGGVQLLQAQGPSYFPRTQEIHLGASTILLMWGLAASSAIIFGLVPAILMTGGPASETLRAGPTSTASTGVRRLRRVLVASQFAITTPLLIAAALLLASLNELRGVDLGFDTQPVLTGSIRLPAAEYQDPDRTRAFWDELRRSVEILPAVAAVAYSDGLPPNQVGNFNNFDLEEHPTPPDQSQPLTPWVAVSPEYFRTVGLTLVDGRLLDERDLGAGSLVVDRAWARRFFPNQSAVGKRLRSGGCTTCPWQTVVGVVTEVKYAGLDQPDQGTVYQPLAPSTARFVVIRAHGDPRAPAAAVQQAVRALEPAAPLSNVATVEDLVNQSLVRPQALSLLVASFAVVALLLSVIGIYGVMGYYVQQHVKEISIRMALGGSQAAVARLVIGQGLTVVGTGIVVGVGVAVGATRWLASLLFGVSTLDPSAYAGASMLLFGVALLACAIPALRAMRLQPATVLRNE